MKTVKIYLVFQFALTGSVILAASGKAPVCPAPWSQSAGQPTNPGACVATAYTALSGVYVATRTPYSLTVNQANSASTGLATVTWTCEAACRPSALVVQNPGTCPVGSFTPPMQDCNAIASPPIVYADGAQQSNTYGVVYNNNNPNQGVNAAATTAKGENLAANNCGGLTGATFCLSTLSQTVVAGAYEGTCCAPPASQYTLVTQCIQNSQCVGSTTPPGAWALGCNGTLADLPEVPQPIIQSGTCGQACVQIALYATDGYITPSNCPTPMVSVPQ